METTKKVHSVKNVSGVAYGDTIKKGGGGGARETHLKLMVLINWHLDPCKHPADVTAVIPVVEETDVPPRGG